MQRAVVQTALAATILVTAGCGSDTDADGEAAVGSSTSAVRSSAHALDGAQAYSSLQDLYDDVTGVGATSCGELREDTTPAAAEAQGRCARDDGELVLQLWTDAGARDDGTTALITALGDIGYCFVLGRDDGAWSINAGDDQVTCHRLADRLGGELFESQPVASSSSSAAAAAAPSQPTVFSGAGDSVVSITKPSGATVVTATITGNDAGRYFGVSALDGDMDQLVNTTEPYSGTTLLDANNGGTTQLEVQAVGPWSITLTDLQFAPTFSKHAEGTGDAVLISEVSGRTATITGNPGGRYFGVDAYGANSTGGSVVNTTDPYTGTVPWPAGRVIVVVTATGSWSIDVG